MTNEALQGIVIGTSTGVLAAFLVYLFVILYKEILIPRYEAMVYKGINLSGQWQQQCEYHDGSSECVPETDHDAFVLQLDQTANAVKGTFSMHFHRGGVLRVGTYRVTGEVVDGYFVATMKTSNRRQSSQGAALFKVISNGNKLEGRFVYKAARDNNVTGLDLDLSRVNV